MNTTAVFHMQPTQKRIRSLFCPRPELLQRPRTPIADRARLWREDPTVSKLAVKDFFHSDKFEFEIAGKHFKFCGGVDNINKAATVASRIGLIFDNAYVDIKMGQREETASIDVDMQVAKIPTNSSLERYRPFVRGNSNLLLSLSFSFRETDLYLADIESMRSGVGGSVVAALYNIAMDLSIPKIWYSVAIDNVNAMQFYYHVDFGRATNRDLTSWEVPIR